MPFASSPHYRWAAWTLIASVAVIRTAYLACWCPLDLASDEAYYWDWSSQLDWSYHSKGPLVAWLIRISCECCGITMLAVRLPAIVCGSLLLLGLFTLAQQCARTIAARVYPSGTVVDAADRGGGRDADDDQRAVHMRLDVVARVGAVFVQARGAWIAAGVCILLGILAKATMVLWLPSLVYFSSRRRNSATTSTKKASGSWLASAHSACPYCSGMPPTAG